MLRSRFETGDLITRGYRESREFTLSIWIVLDPSFRFGTLEWTKLQVLQSALQLIGESLIGAGHRGEIVVLSAERSELLPFASVPEMARTMTRVIELVRGDAVLKSLNPQASHILRLSQNPDSKVALFTPEPSDAELRAQLAQKHIDLHEFVIEHPEEYFQNE
jgi:uncharacterized protein (DUF58 family)